MARTNTTPAITLKSFLAVTVIAIGFVSLLYASRNTTSYKQEASIVDLNTGDQITTANNPDGTMGPAAANGNFSNTLPQSYLGTLAVKVIDPVPGMGNGSMHGKKTGNPHYQSTPTPVSESSESETNPTPGLGFTALYLTFSKVEVHLASLCEPGKLTNYPNKENKLVPSPNSNPHGNPKKVTGADKWETIPPVDSEGYGTIDLMQLAATDLSETLGLSQLACGKYTEVRLYVSEATLTLDNGQDVKVTIPGNKSIVRIVRPFRIDPGQQTEITVDFNAAKSVKKTGDTWVLKPVIARFITTK